MFDRLFTQSAALTRHRAAPLVEERRAYLTQLSNQGTPLETLRDVARYVLAVTGRLRLVDRPGESIGREEIERQAARWARRKPRLAQWRGGASSREDFILRATRWLQFLGRLQQPAVPASPIAEKLQHFADDMEHERGLASETIQRRCWVLLRILSRLADASGSLRKVTPHRIDQAFQEMLKQGRYSRVSIQAYASDLRVFFRFAERRGWCRQDLAASIQSPRVFSLASLPGGPTWDDVQQLLAMTDGDRLAGRRDRAILMLLAVYGLRAGEVRQLRLEDFDWEQELLSVSCTKTRRRRTYPLVRPVGEAVLQYLKARPRCQYREMFLTLQAPIRPVGKLWHLVAPRLRRLGVTLPHYGPHSLRHACATHLLTQGLSLKEIGDHLGHQDPDATRIYAKVDLVGLRQVADFSLGGLL